tara:strand:+ start:219 stop:725 length:507 start_codon:yes stop_codon:yes gene_type:complete
METKSQIAQRFIDAHRINGLDAWAMNGPDRDSKDDPAGKEVILESVFDYLVGDAYGECRLVDSATGEYEIEIGRFDSASHQSQIFNFYHPDHVFYEISWWGATDGKLQSLDFAEKDAAEELAQAVYDKQGKRVVMVSYKAGSVPTRPIPTSTRVLAENGWGNGPRGEL